MSVKETNPSFVLQRVGEFAFEDRPVPELIHPTDVLIRIQVTGICGSDVHYWQHGEIGPYKLLAPLTLGHESSGTIEKVGKGVKTLMPGDRVALEPGTPCNICPLCKAGRYNLCADMKFAATPPYDGTLTRFYVLPEDMCVRLPAHVSLEEGALVEPLSVAMHACRGRVNFGDSVVVFGAGTIGLLVSAVAARAFGARKVVIVDINAKRVEFAREFVGGVAMGVESKELDVRGVVDEVLGNLDSGNFMAGADVAVEATGAESCIQSAVGVVRRGGTIVQVGMGQNIVSYPISEMATKEVQMRGSFRYSAGDYVLAVQLISEGKVDVKKLVTGRYKFKDSEKAFEETKRGTGIKVLIMGPDSVIQ